MLIPYTSLLITLFLSSTLYAAPQDEVSAETTTEEGSLDTEAFPCFGSWTNGVICPRGNPFVLYGTCSGSSCIDCSTNAQCNVGSTNLRGCLNKAGSSDPTDVFDKNGYCLRKCTDDDDCPSITIGSLNIAPFACGALSSNAGLCVVKNNGCNAALENVPCQQTATDGVYFEGVCVKTTGIHGKCKTCSSSDNDEDEVSKCPEGYYCKNDQCQPGCYNTLDCDRSADSEENTFLPTSCSNNVCAFSTCDMNSDGTEDTCGTGTYCKLGESGLKSCVPGCRIGHNSDCPSPNGSTQFGPGVCKRSGVTNSCVYSTCTSSPDSCTTPGEYCGNDPDYTGLKACVPGCNNKADCVPNAPTGLSHLPAICNAETHQCTYSECDPDGTPGCATGVCKQAQVNAYSLYKCVNECTIADDCKYPPTGKYLNAVCNGNKCEYSTCKLNTGQGCQDYQKCVAVTGALNKCEASSNGGGNGTNKSYGKKVGASCSTKKSNDCGSGKKCVAKYGYKGRCHPLAKPNKTCGKGYKYPSVCSKGYKCKKNVCRKSY